MLTVLSNNGLTSYDSEVVGLMEMQLMHCEDKVCPLLVEALLLSLCSFYCTTVLPGAGGILWIIALSYHFYVSLVYLKRLLFMITRST